MKKISLVLSLSFLLLLLIFSCRDDYNYDSASKPLRFSKDTVMLDTVFATVRSETYVLKVYNQQNEDVTIPRIYLEKGASSQFKINVDGVPGGSENNNSFQNVPIRAKDSLYIFIEIAPNAISSSEAVADEDLIFNTIGHTQKVKLLSLVEDADFYYSSTGTKEISSDMTWDNSKSRVIYGNLKFINGSKLTIQEGTKVYLHNDANLIIDTGGQLNINGVLNKEVIIRGDRHDPKYDSLPGNWNQIQLATNSTAIVNYANVKGGNNAFYIESGANLTISNSKIFNFMNSGIYSIGGKVTGTNLAMNNCGSADLLVENGGTYDFTHCSFANYWNLDVAPAYSVYLSNSYQGTSGIVYNPLNAVFKNCIFWGKNANSVYFKSSSSAPFNYIFDTNLVKNNNGVTITGNPNFINTFVNQDPLFTQTLFSNTLLNLKAGSLAFGKGNLTYASAVPQDITGTSRTNNPTLGAYQN